MTSPSALTELFPDTFIQSTSDFSGCEDFLGAIGAEPAAITCLEELDTKHVNTLIAERTDFACWSDMVQAGKGQLFAAQIRQRLPSLAS